MIALFLFFGTAAAETDVFERVEHHFADNGGVRIHYVSLGEGPVLIMLHGFPDFWYTWRYQMAELSKDYRVVAVDLRGYNQSDKPAGVENYRMPVLMSDVIAVIDDLKLEKATLIANDWGGAIAWQVATFYPHRVERLIACNIPHPAGIRAYLDKNPETGNYAENFKKEGAARALTAEGLADLHGNNLDKLERARYVEAFRNSSFAAMLNYYKANYPRPASKKNKTAGVSVSPSPSTTAIRKVKCPVLIIHGMKDTALPAGMLNNTWSWIDNDLTIQTIPGAGHFVQQEAPDKVSRMIRSWLAHTN